MTGGDEDPDYRRFGPWMIFLIVLVIFSWALAIKTWGAR